MQFFCKGCFMGKDAKYKELESLAHDLTLLYVEDNLGIQKLATKVFEKFFTNIVLANDGEEGLRLFKEHNPEIIVTDIQMPNMSGLEMLKKIRELNFDTKVIITSAYDDKENLFDAIEVGVSQYLKKPISVDTLVTSLLKIVKGLKQEANQRLFNQYINDVFQNQDNMLILLEKKEPIIVNQKTLDFFAQENTSSFKKLFQSFDKLILKHNNFLYNQEGIEWLSTAQKNMGKLFNVKIANQNGESRHFILKAYEIPKKEDYCILSFDDITELNLLGVYDKDAVENESKENEQKSIFNLFKIVKRNQSQVRLYNSYKGLNISNVGVVVGMSENSVIFRTKYLQQRAININQHCTIESEIFPKAIFGELKQNDFESEEVELENLVLVDKKPSEQVNVRVVPEDSSKVTLFQGQRKLSIELSISDISVDGVNLCLEVLPPHFTVGEIFRVHVVVNSDKQPIIVDLQAKLFLLHEKKRYFEAVFLFEDKIKAKKLLISYIAKRQMALIREFKMLKYAKSKETK